MPMRLFPDRTLSLDLPRRRRRGAPWSRLLALAVVLALLQPVLARAQRVALLTRADHAIRANDAVDSGAAAGSQAMALTLGLKPSAQQAAALDALLRAQADSSAPGYHKWLTPETFAAQFGATDAELATLTAWLSARGLSVTSVAPSRTRISVTGEVASVEAAFAVPVRRMTAGGSLFYANAAQPTVPAELASLLDTITGLDDLPTAASAHIAMIAGVPASAVSPPAHAMASSAEVVAELVRGPAAVATDPLARLSELVEANTTAVVTLDSTACLSDLSDAEIREYRALLRQANAQGTTVLATSECAANASGSTPLTAEAPAFPAALAEVTAITVVPAASKAPATTAAEARPAWQAAPGLPADALRHEPDLTTSSAAAFAQTVTSLNQQLGERVGNLNATLYALAKTPGLFTQAAPETSAAAAPGSSAGQWESATGLGTINLAKLLKVFPHAGGAISTITGVQSTSYGVNYGDSFTLTAKVVPASYGMANPTGTVTFMASTQGTLGSSTIDGNGNASLTPDVLPAGTYSISAVYSGDGLYSGSASTIKATVTISPVNARVTASVAPATNVPYGATATVTATVALPGANASPTGPVSAQIEGITGAFATATLSPNPGGNTATANIVLSAPSPGTYEIDVTCQGTANFQCQTPQRLSLKTVKGYTNTTVSVTPAAPQAGQPITLTATVANAGNDSDSYTFNGSVSFYDSGKLLATAPVATNQATTVQTLSGTRTHNITASYTGDANWNPSLSGAVAVAPTLLPDTLTLASTVSSSNSLAGVNIIFTATSTTTITYGTGPTGTITFFDTFNGAVVQLGNPATLVANGPTASVALFTTTGLLPGVHRIYAQYSGDNNYASSTSAVLALTLSDFSVTMTPTSLAIAQGKGQQVTVFVGESGGFAGTVSLGCTPPPSSLATCSFAPASVTGGGSTTLTITTTAATSATAHAAEGRTAGLAGLAMSWRAGTGASLAALLMLVLPRRRRVLPSLLTIFFAAAMLSASLGCGLGMTSGASSGAGTGPDSGSGSSGSTATNGTPLGTQNYVITAAGTDGVNTIRHTYQYQVTVQ